MNGRLLRSLFAMLAFFRPLLALIFLFHDLPSAPKNTAARAARHTFFKWSREIIDTGQPVATRIKDLDSHQGTQQQ